MFRLNVHLKTTKHGIRLRESKHPNKSCSEAGVEILHYALTTYLALDW